MTLKSLFLKILLVVGILVVLFAILLYFTLRTKVDDISKIAPYKSITGTHQTTKQVSYLVENYKAFVQENPYLLKLNKDFYSKVGAVYEIPIGTKLRIEKTKTFTNGVSGATHTYVLGFIYVEELQKEVAFEFSWDGEKPLEIEQYEDYLRYPLTPWQDQPLPLKFSLEDNSVSSYQWPAITSNPTFNKILDKVWVSNTYRGNRNFENTTFDKNRYEVGMNYFAEDYYLILGEQLPLMQLDEVYPDFNDNSAHYIVGHDHRINFSPNYVSIFLTILIHKYTMESTLITYDLDGKYIDHVLLSVADRTEGAKQVAEIEGFTITTKSKSSSNSGFDLKKSYEMNETGFIEMK